MGKPRIQPTISFVISFIPAWVGKTRSIDSRQDSKRGSSPLPRGKPSSLPGELSRWLAHPRSRGENDARAYDTRIATGSSPLTRGKLDVNLDVVQRRRLIPAHAGKTV